MQLKEWLYKKTLSALLAVIAMICAVYGINLKYEFIDTGFQTEYSSQQEEESVAVTISAAEQANTETQTVLQKAVSDNQYSFRSKKLFDEHYKKHGAEFGDITQEEYLAGANALITNKNALQKTEEDGDKLFYIESSNEFGVLSSDGYIRTYFRPDSGIDYWNRQ